MYSCTDYYVIWFEYQAGKAKVIRTIECIGFKWHREEILGSNSFKSPQFALSHDPSLPPRHSFGRK
jgi:hypothetical protein